MSDTGKKSLPEGEKCEQEIGRPETGWTCGGKGTFSYPHLIALSGPAVGGPFPCPGCEDCTGKKPLPEAAGCGGGGFQCTDPSEESYIANEREQLEIEKLQIIRHNGLLVDGSAAKRRLEEINATLKRLDESAEECDVPPPGWRCTRPKGHDGPCAAWPAEPEPESVDGEEWR
jgi:hypothetical protein